MIVPQNLKNLNQVIYNPDIGGESPSTTYQFTKFVNNVA